MEKSRAALCALQEGLSAAACTGTLPTSLGREGMGSLTHMLLDLLLLLPCSLPSHLTNSLMRLLNCKLQLLLAYGEEKGEASVAIIVATGRRLTGANAVAELATRRRVEPRGRSMVGSFATVGVKRGTG